MPLPGDVTTTTVTGYFADSAGNPVGGTVAFTPTAPLTNPAGMLVIPAVTRSYTLQGGKFTSDPLVSTDNVTLSPSGWAYDVKVSIENIAPYSFTTFLPSAPSPVDFSALEPVFPAGTVLGPAGYLPTSGGTETGTLVLDGVPPLYVPGATVGQILASDSSGNFTLQNDIAASTNVVDGVTVSGITAAGRVIMATDATHATWQLPLQVDATNGDIKQLGASAAWGSLQQAAAADHVHPRSGLVTGVTAADTSIVVGGTSQAPTIATATLDVIASDHAPAAAVGLNSQKITGLANGTAVTDAMAFGQQVPAVGAGGNSLLAWSYDPMIASSTSLATLGTVYLIQFNLPYPTTLGTIWWLNSVAAVTPTSGQSQAGIYSSPGTLVASATTTATATAMTGTSGISVALSSSYAAAAGLYWVGLVFQAATAPTMLRATQTNGGFVNVGITSATKYRTCINGTGITTALPSSITPSSNSVSGNQNWWVGVS